MPIIPSGCQFPAHTSPKEDIPHSRHKSTLAPTITLAFLCHPGGHRTHFMPCCGKRILDYRHSVDTLPILHPGGPFLMKAEVGISVLIQSVCSILSTHRVLTPPLRVPASENICQDNSSFPLPPAFPSPFLRE